MALFRSGRKNEAVAALRRAIALDARDGQAQRNLASVLLEVHDVGGALTHAEQAVRLLPSDAAAHAMLGSVLIRVGRFDDAIHHFRLALDIDPTRRDAGDSLSGLLQRRSPPVR